MLCNGGKKDEEGFEKALVHLAKLWLEEKDKNKKAKFMQNIKNVATEYENYLKKNKELDSSNCTDAMFMQAIDKKVEEIIQKVAQEEITSQELEASRNDSSFPPQASTSTHTSNFQQDSNLPVITSYYSCNPELQDGTSTSTAVADNLYVPMTLISVSDDSDTDTVESNASAIPLGSETILKETSQTIVIVIEIQNLHLRLRL